MTKLDNISDYFMLKISSQDIEEFDLITVKKGQTIFNEGNRPLGVYFLKDGMVKVYKLGSDGKEQIIKIAKPGSYLGYAETLAESRYNSSVTALEDTTLYFIPKSDFMGLLQTDTGSLNNFIKLLYNDLVAAEEKMTEIAYKPVRGRVAEALINLKQNYNNSTILLSRNDLAKMVGTASETVIRLLSEFKKDKLISLKGRSIVIEDPIGLHKISHLYD